MTSCELKKCNPVTNLLAVHQILTSFGFNVLPDFTAIVKKS